MSCFESTYGRWTHTRRPGIRWLPRTSSLALLRCHEQSRTALGPEPTRVYGQHVDDVVDRGQTVADLSQISTAPRREEARHVLEQDGGRRNALYAQASHDVQKRPDRPRMPAGQTSAVPGEGKINAREGRGHEVQTGGQVADAEVVDVTKKEVLAAESVPVHLLLTRRNVVGEDALPAKRLYRLTD